MVLIRDLAFLTLQVCKVLALVAGSYAMVFAWFLVS